MTLMPIPRFVTNSYKANAVNFDGNTWLSRTLAFSGIAQGKKGTFSVWVKTNTVGAALFFIGYGTPANKFVANLTGSQYQIAGNNAGGTAILTEKSSANYPTPQGWTHFLASFDGNTGINQLYINGTSDLLTSTNTGGVIAYDGDRIGVGTNFNFPTSKIVGDMADLYFNAIDAVDLSVQANRDKFIKNGKPVFLGASGQLPTGSSPTVLLSNSAATFQNNLGTGGNFSIAAGALTAASTSPSD